LLAQPVTILVGNASAISWREQVTV
jgi:hypothetical protein